MKCKICGGTGGSLNDNGEHWLCHYRAKRGVPTPSLGDKCPKCNGAGVIPRSSQGPCLSADLGPRLMEQAIKAWAPDCPVCNGNRVVNAG